MKREFPLLAAETLRFRAVTTKAESSSDAVERIGAYRVVRRLATGGTSDVLLAKAEGPHGFERTVVLKVLLSHFGKDDEVAKMFAREASAYARLSHPAIVRLFDFFSEPGVDPKKKGNSRLVMVLEYVDGPPLARLKSMAKAIGKELDDKAAIYIAACIFDALAAAHSAVDDAQIPAPVIHRDVNPSNVLIPWDGFPKLADFGVAKVTGLGHHSVVGMIKGTYGYMSPEQVAGGEAVTPRSDVYAAAIILWELLTKRRAFQRGALPEVEALRAMAEPRLPALESIRADVDRSVREALRRALEPRAEKRKITAEEMVSILHGVVPPDQGRERLMALLQLVRNDARAANAVPSVAPPPMPEARRSEPLLPDVVIPGAPKMAPDFGPLTLSGNPPPPTQQGLGTPSRTIAKASPPRPSVKGQSSAKFPAAAPAVPTTTLSSVGAPAPPATPPVADGPLSLPTRPAMPAVTAPPPVAPPPQPNRIASRPNLPAVGGSLPAPLPPPDGPPRTKSAAARLAVSIPPETVQDPPGERLSSILDGLEHTMSLPPDSPRTAAPLKDLTGGLGLRDAIDEIMKSSQRIPVAAPVRDNATPPTGLSGAPEGMRETTRVPAGMTSTLIGVIPPAPPPLSPSGFPHHADASQNEVVTTPPGPVQSDFPNSNDDSLEPPPDTTVVMEPIPVPPPRVQNAPKFNSTVVMEARPMETRPSSEPGSLPSLPVSGPHMPVATPYVSHPTPAPMAAVSASNRPPIGAQYVGSDPRPSTPAPSYRPPAKKGIGVGTVAIVLGVIIALGIAGSIAFVRYQAQKENADAGAYLPPSRLTASETPVVAPPAPSESAAPTPVESAAPAVSASAAPPAVSASAALPASASAAPSAAVAEGMGVITTANTAPGRRIFVDDKVVGQTPSSITVTCGAHRVKLGSTGSFQQVDVPCGGELAVGDK